MQIRITDFTFRHFLKRVESGTIWSCISTLKKSDVGHDPDSMLVLFHKDDFQKVQKALKNCGMPVMHMEVYTEHFQIEE